jgi:hypothetical protein
MVLKCQVGYGLKWIGSWQFLAGGCKKLNNLNNKNVTYLLSLTDSHFRQKDGIYSQGNEW